MPDRFYVIECEGWTINPASHAEPPSVSVLDRLDAHREVASWDTSCAPGAQLGKPRMRAAAAAEAARLNASVR